jgi:hypothetical protein
VSCWIVGGSDGIDAFSYNSSVAHDERAERPACAGKDVLGGHRDGAAQEDRIRSNAWHAGWPPSRDGTSSDLILNATEEGIERPFSFHARLLRG